MLYIYIGIMSTNKEPNLENKIPIKGSEIPVQVNTNEIPKKIKKPRKQLSEEQKIVMLNNLAIGRAKAHEKRRTLEATAKVPVSVPETVEKPVVKKKEPLTKKKKIVYQSESSSEEEIVYVKRKSKAKPQIEPPVETKIEQPVQQPIELPINNRQNAIYKNIFG
jgi:predicted  nucleic acid-binding Zn-ribbon protein